MATTKATTLAHTIASTTSSTADLNYAKTLNDTGVTSTEFDKLDGLTATTDELNLVDGSVTGSLSHRNCVINGGMQVFQRGSSATGVTGYDWKAGDADRFRFQPYNCGTYTIGTVDGPLAEAGIKNALKIDCTTADSSPASGDEVKLTYAFEGQDIQHFKKGTASAQPMILSFWIRAKIQNVANPTFNIHISDKDNAREVGAQYTVTASADTDSGWQRKIITIPADTTGQFDDDHEKSMEFTWWFGGGSNQTGGTTIAAWRANGSIADQRANSTGNVNLHTNNYVYITGVQLELGSATPFEHRTYAEELARCQRYYWRIDGNIYQHFAIYHRFNTNNHVFPIHLPVPMRHHTPTIFQANLGRWSSPVGSWSTSYTSVTFYDTIDSPNNFTLVPFQMTGSGGEDTGLMGFQANGYLALEEEL